MPEFILYTRGAVAPPIGVPVPWPHPLKWDDLSAIAQGYIEALFFTECEHGSTRDGDGARKWNHETDSSLPGDVGFSDLAPQTLLAILKDCRAFEESDAWRTWVDADNAGGADFEGAPDEAQAGRDFWYTRNGHGCGFWDGDWPEPYASALDGAARQFRNVDAYVGDDGLLYLA